VQIGGRRLMVLLFACSTDFFLLSAKLSEHAYATHQLRTMTTLTLYIHACLRQMHKHAVLW